MWHQQILVRIHALLLVLLTAASIRLGEVVVGTACSGSDIAWKTLMASNVCFAANGVEFNFVHGFAAEQKPNKLEFLRKQFPGLQALVNDNNLLLQLKAHCHIHEKEVIIPSAVLFTAGFVCTSRTPNNKNRSEFKGCLQTGKNCPTQSSYTTILAIIALMLPIVVILENVKELLEETFVSLEVHSDAHKFGRSTCGTPTLQIRCGRTTSSSSPWPATLTVLSPSA